jgi:hypothetical protein
MVRNASCFAFATALALAAPGVALADTAPVAAQVESTRAPVKAQSTSESKDYSQRETKDKAVADYKGGNTVVIAMSGGAFVVLILLLLLL